MSEYFCQCAIIADIKTEVVWIPSSLAVVGKRFTMRNSDDKWMVTQVYSSKTIEPADASGYREIK